MSTEATSESAAPTRSDPSLPIFVRAVIYGVVWLPFLGLVAFYVPRFDGLFEKLRERGELPALTEWLMWFGALNHALFCLPCLVLFGLLLAADASMAGMLRRRWRKGSLYRIWFAGVIIAGILAAALGMVALLLPAWKMGTTI